MASMLKAHKKDPQGQKWDEKKAAYEKSNHPRSKFDSGPINLKKG
jgi:hypothetical protein